MCQITWTPPPPLFNGTQNTCACSCKEALNAWKHVTLKDVWISLNYLRTTWRGIHDYTRSFIFLEGKVMAILPFKEGFFGIIWAHHSCFSLTHLCRCVSAYVLFQSCVNNTRQTLPLIGLSWNVTVPQTIVIVYAIVSCSLTKEEQ